MTLDLLKKLKKFRTRTGGSTVEIGLYKGQGRANIERGKLYNHNSKNFEGNIYGGEAAVDRNDTEGDISYNASNVFAHFDYQQTREYLRIGLALGYEPHKLQSMLNLDCGVWDVLTKTRSEFSRLEACSIAGPFSTQGGLDFVKERQDDDRLGMETHFVRRAIGNHKVLRLKKKGFTQIKSMENREGANSSIQRQILMQTDDRSNMKHTVEMCEHYCYMRNDFRLADLGQYKLDVFKKMNDYYPFSDLQLSKTPATTCPLHDPFIFQEEYLFS